MDKKIYAHLSVSKSSFNSLLSKNEYKCNAASRLAMSKLIQVLTPRQLPDNTSELIRLAELIGGCRPGENFVYPTPHGLGKTKVVDLYNLPEKMVNPFVVCFSGHINAYLYTLEAIRWHIKQTGELLPLLSIGKGGNKGLFEKVYNREKGLVIGTEYEAYLNILCKLMPRHYVRRYQQVFNDMDTEGNLRELYRFAKEQGLKEVSYILITGQPWYDKRVLAEWMLMLSSEEFSDVKINLVLAHCPIWQTSAVPEGHPSEIMLGYIQASIGPLLKDTISFYGHTKSQKPERYLMSDIVDTDWNMVKTIISDYGNMGWPNYEELLFGTPHKEAVRHIILADLFARSSFTPESYDKGVEIDIAGYQALIGRCERNSMEAFFHWCIETPNIKFFPETFLPEK